MKNIIVSFLLIVCTNAFAATDYLPGKYSIDPDHTRISFIIRHFVISEVEGRFNDVQGEFTLPKSFTDLKVTATVPVASIDTGVKKRDEDLRSKNFFEVAKYPEMKLVSKSITGTPESFKMLATLTIKDVTKDVTFEGKYTGSVKDPWGKQRAAFQVTGSVNRKDFHINYDQKLGADAAVGDMVKIHVWTEAVKVGEVNP